MNWGLFLNSLLLAGTIALGSSAVGWIAAVGLTTLGGRLHRVGFLLAVITLVMPSFLVVDTWLGLLGDTGMLKAWLPITIYSPGGAAWVLTLMLWPIPFLFTWGALKRVPREFLEVEPSLGCAAVLALLIWPATVAALARAALVVFVLAFNNIAVPAILQVKVYPVEFWIQFSTTYNLGMAWKYGWVMAAPPTLLLLLFFRGQPVAWPWETGGPGPEIFRKRLGAWLSGFCVVVALGVGLISAALPLLNMITSPQTWDSLGDALKAGGVATWNSLRFAFGTATLVLLAGIALRKMPALGVLWIAFFLPGTLVGAVCIWGFNRPWLAGIYQGGWIMVLVLSVRYLALGWQGAVWAGRMVDRDLDGMARMQGIPWWQRWRHVDWPQAGPFLAVTWYAVYLLCLWDTETVVLVVPPGGETLALRVFNMLHYGHIAHVNALCLALVGLAILPLVFWKVANFFTDRPDDS